MKSKNSMMPISCFLSIYGSQNYQMMVRLNSHQRRSSKSERPNPEFREALSRLTVHGVPEIYGNKSTKWKTTWILILLIAGISLTFEIIRTINNYLDSPVSTTYSVAPLNEMKFPKIYLCPLNVVDRRKTEMFGTTMLKQLNKFFDLGASLASNVEQFLSKINANYDVTLYSFATFVIPREPDLNIIGLLDMVSLQRQDFIRECSFERRSLNCENITTRVFDGNYGQCFLVSVDKAQQIPSFGLTLVLDIRRDLYDKQVMPTFDGVRLDVIDDYGPIQSHSSILLAPGGWTKITMHSRKYELLNCRSKVLNQPCRKLTSGDWKYRNLNHSEYTRESCRFDCALNATLLHCQCLLPVNPKFYKIDDVFQWKICDTDQMRLCFYDKVMKNSTNIEFTKCSSQCLDPCIYWKHDFGSISHVQFSSTTAANSCDTTNATAARRCMKDLIILDIGYSDLMYTKITQISSMTFDTFLSNIGGQVGLWMGVSFISLVQILALMLLYFKDKFVGNNHTP